MKNNELREKIEEIINRNIECDCPCSGPFCNSITHPHKENCPNNKDYVELLLFLFESTMMEVIGEDEEDLCVYNCTCNEGYRDVNLRLEEQRNRLKEIMK